MSEDLTKFTDEELVVHLASDQMAFAEIMARYEAKLKRYIRRLGVLNEDDQLDVLQEIFLKVYKNINSFDQSLSFSSWLYRIAHNEAMTWYRKLSVRPEGHSSFEGDDVLALLADTDDSPELMFDRSVEADQVAMALDKLSDKYKEILVLRYFEHKEYDEISDILKIPIGSVGTLVHRGKKKLADVLNVEQTRINNEI